MMESNASEMDIDLQAGFGHQIAQKSRKCRYCSAWSSEPSPWPLQGTPLASWAPNIPWGRGKQSAPIGSICKPCVIVTELKLVPFFFFENLGYHTLIFDIII